MVTMRVDCLMTWHTLAPQCDATVRMDDDAVFVQCRPCVAEQTVNMDDGSQRCDVGKTMEAQGGIAGIEMAMTREHSFLFCFFF